MCGDKIVMEAPTFGMKQTYLPAGMRLEEMGMCHILLLAMPEGYKSRTGPCSIGSCRKLCRTTIQRFKALLQACSSMSKASQPINLPLKVCMRAFVKCTLPSSITKYADLAASGLKHDAARMMLPSRQVFVCLILPRSVVVKLFFKARQ